MELTLYGYHYSVYVRIVRLVMVEKQLAWAHVEIDPFAPLPASYLEMNPFARVPTLRHKDFAIYETTAITRYLDEMFDSRSLQPHDRRERARMNQFIAVADSYAYWPMVRQVYAQRVFRPALGELSDEDEIAKGLVASEKVLAALDDLAGNVWLCGRSITLADMHLGAMIGCFTAAPEGSQVLGRYSKLRAWWDKMRLRQSYIVTDPGLPELK